MFYLLLSVLLNAYIGVLFAFFNKYKIDIFQAIVFNYGVCVITGSVVLGHFPLHVGLIHETYFTWALLMGALFISVFNLIGLSSVKVGITITQTANKLSLVIPVMFACLLYNESISLIKGAGILLALIAVIFISSKNSNLPQKKISILEYALPVTLFVSSGIIDTLTKYVQNRFLISESISNTYLISGFCTAFVLGIIVLIGMYITQKKTFNFRFLLAGVILGIPNYFSIYYLVKALQSDALSSSAIIPINNIGVLFVVSLVGIFIFKEKLSKANYLGLVLSLFAILLIFLGDKI